MGRKKKALTIEQHKENGIQLTRARNAILKAEIITWDCSSNDRKVCYKEIRIAVNAIDKVRNKLDFIYHQHITKEEFNEHGHVYYGRSHVDRKR
jgi:hypothetical protein